MKLETVKIQRDDGYVIINKSDIKEGDRLFGVAYDNHPLQGSHYQAVVAEETKKPVKKAQAKKSMSKKVK